MFIWQYIDVPALEIESIKQQVRDNLPDNGDFFQKLDVERTTFLDLEIDAVVLIQAAPGFGIDRFGIHKDASDEQGRTLAINIPFENCEGSITKFYKTDKPEVTQFLPNGLSYNLFESKDCEEISEFRLTQPIVFNTQIPHLVVNPQNVWRRAISVRFKKDPWHLIKK